MIADLLVRLSATLGILLLSAAFGMIPPVFTGPWWFLIIAAGLLGHVAASMSAKGATK